MSLSFENSSKPNRPHAWLWARAVPTHLWNSAHLRGWYLRGRHRNLDNKSHELCSRFSDRVVCIVGSANLSTRNLNSASPRQANNIFGCRSLAPCSQTLFWRLLHDDASKVMTLNRRVFLPLSKTTFLPSRPGQRGEGRPPQVSTSVSHNTFHYNIPSQAVYSN